MLLVSPNLGDYMTDKLILSFSTNKNVSALTVAGINRHNKTYTDNRIVLAKAASTNFIKRILKYPIIFWKIKKLLKTSDVIASWTCDTAFLCVLASKILCSKKKKFIYIYSDVHPLCTKKNSFLSRLFRKIECFTARHADIVSFTSPLFKTEYFGRIAGAKITNSIIIENKIPNQSVERIIRNLNIKNRDFSEPRIGYFGLLSYKDAFDFIEMAAKSDIKTYIRGRISPSIAKDIPEVIGFGGEYKYPEDLPEMFEKINMSYIIHNFEPDTNYQWQMTNRFYDALMTQTPMVVQKGTANEKFIIDNDIGISIDIYSPEESIAKLKSITKSDIIRWTENFFKLSKNTWMLTDEYDKLFDRIS